MKHALTIAAAGVVFRWCLWLSSPHYPSPELFATYEQQASCEMGRQQLIALTRLPRVRKLAKKNPHGKEARAITIIAECVPEGTEMRPY